MILNGKKTEKWHIRLTEDIAREVRAIADLEHRPYQDQLRFFVVMGLQAFRSRVHGNGDQDRRTLPLNAAPEEMRNDFHIPPAPPRAARSRTLPQQNRRRA